MSYATVEAAALTVLRTHADYDTSNCTAGDVSPIKKGLERVARIWFDSSRREDLTITLMRHTWTLRVDVYVPYRGRIQDMEGTMAAEMQKVIDTFANYPLLDDLSGVSRAEITNGIAPEPLNPKNTAYRGQRLYLEVKETVKPTRVG